MFIVDSSETKKRKPKHTLWFSREALKLFSRTNLRHDF